MLIANKTHWKKEKREGQGGDKEEEEEGGDDADSRWLSLTSALLNKRCLV